MAKIFRWRIKEQFFPQMKSGLKNLEVRVGYESIKKVHRGDIIQFERHENDKFVVKDVRKYKDFYQMLSIEDAECILPGSDAEMVLKTLRRIYPRDKEQLGVYVFCLSLDNRKVERKYVFGSQLLADGKHQELSRLIFDSYKLTDWISKDYPNHFNHYYGKYVPGLLNGEREIISCYIDGKIVGTAFMKKDSKEKKLSTLFVLESFRGQKIASELLRYGFSWLGTSRPVATIADFKLEQFKAIIQQYHWEVSRVLDMGYYNSHSREYVFNE